MIPTSIFSVNTYDKLSLPKAAEAGFGLEVEEYLWTYTEDEIRERHGYVPKLMEGFSSFSFHGTAVSRDAVEINRLTDDELLAVYNESYGHSRFHGIEKIVFHSNYISGLQPRDEWIKSKADFWRRFLADKTSGTCVYVENFIDDTPDLLAGLCDTVADARFRICLDTGHALCNSRIPLTEWIATLGRRIEHVHLHNNDGLSDKHWPLGKGILDMKDVIGHLLAHSNVRALVLECDFADSLNWLHDTFG